MCLQSPQMFFHNLFPAADTCCGSATCTHGDKILLNVFGLDAVDEDESQQVLKVGRNAVGGIEAALALIHRPATIEGGMGRHEAKAHQRAPEDGGRVVAHAF